jgi:hypothetical protein
LGGEIVDFVGLDFSEQTSERAGVGQIAIMQEEAGMAEVRVGIDGVEAAGVKGAGATNDAVNFVSFTEEQLSEVGAVLSSDSGDEGFFRHEGDRVGKTKWIRKSELKKLAWGTFLSQHRGR